METHYASPERAPRAELESDIRNIGSDPVISGLMNILSGLLAVLNEHRQILAVNDYYLKLLNMDDARKIIGLRPGESINCVHAHELPGGCGTSEYCSSCGAAIAIVSSMASDKPVEQKCAVTVEKNGKRSDLLFKVRAMPVLTNNRRYILLFLNDISKEQRWGAIERLFFHDLKNIIHAILSRSELMVLDPEAQTSQMAHEINALSLRLSNEISIQRQMHQEGVATYQPVYHLVSLQKLLKEACNVFSDRCLKSGKRLVLKGEVPDIEIKTDYSVTLRILINMMSNALDATPEGQQVEVSVKHDQKRVRFYVWNIGHIPDSIGKRIFQRNFSTKEGAGRGLGTYSMKYFGEEVLGGKVDFTSSGEEGTVFRLELPVDG
jgi:signal transduction histidine kinase